jgi:hypothetical protein
VISATLAKAFKMQKTIYCVLPSLLGAEITGKPESAVTRLGVGIRENRKSVCGAVRIYLASTVHIKSETYPGFCPVSSRGYFHQVEQMGSRSV